MERPDSLCARVLKGRYFPDSDFLNANYPNSASPMWKAIFKGREVLKQGLIRRVGDGTTTEIWHDRWIEGSRSMVPMGRRLYDDPVLFVPDLIDEGSSQWIEPLVRRVFYPPDVDLILAMPR